MFMYTWLGLSKIVCLVIFILSNIPQSVQQCTVPSVTNGGYSDCTAGATIAAGQTCAPTCDSGYRTIDFIIACQSGGAIATPTCSESSCYSSESCLKDDLFEAYDPTVRPTLESSDVLNVTVSLYIRALIGINERDEIMTIVGWLILGWTDAYLTWSPPNYGSIGRMAMPANEVWLPDSVIINSAESYYKSTYKDDFRVWIIYNGLINWRFGGHLQTTCALDITYYPFDTQTCYVVVRNWLFPASVVDLLVADDAILTSDFQEHGLWEMKKASAKKIYDGNPSFAQVIFSIEWKRKPQYYVFNIILPTLFIVFITLGQFWLPAGSGERVSLGITILLAFSVFQIIIASSTPVNSNTSPVISRLVLFVMTMATISLLFAIIAVFLDSKTDATRVPKFLRVAAFHWLARFLCMSGEVQHVSENLPIASNKIMPVTNQEAMIEEKPKPSNSSSTELNDILTAVNEINDKMKKAEESENIINEWKLLSKLIDRFLFWISLLVVIMYFISVAAELDNTK